MTPQEYEQYKARQECKRCGKLGHYIKECTETKDKKGQPLAPNKVVLRNLEQETSQG